MEEKKCLLIVDDALFMRKKLINILREKLGEEFSIIDEATDGWDALRKYEEKKYEIVIMDINMPGMTGIEALKAIRKINPNVFVIIVTVSEKESMRKAAMAAGAYDYIVKPCDNQQIEVALKKALLNVSNEETS